MDNMINQIVEVVEVFFKALLKIIDLVEENGRVLGSSLLNDD